MTGKVRPFCWQCGGDLSVVKGQLSFVEVELPGGNKVRCHKICVKGALNFAHFDTTPAPDSLEPQKRGSIELRQCSVCGCDLPVHWSFSVCPAHQGST